MAAQKRDFALLGHIVYTPTPEAMAIYPNHYLVCKNGKSAGVYAALTADDSRLPIYDYRDHIVLPGLCDTHVHAPQYAFRGLGMDMELLDWLNSRTFPEEARYSDIDYAETAYALFANALRRGATTRAAVFATTHIPATMALMRLMEKTGLNSFVGKVSMDENAPASLLEGDAALERAEEWITSSLSAFRRTKPIITPRFVPSCSAKLLKGLGKLVRKYDLPVQSHLSENRSEAEWVKELCPWSDSYGDVYEIFDLFGDGIPTVMAHCVHSDAYERKWLKRRGVLISHCPASNINLSSGIAPVRKYLDDGIRVSLGSDIAGGFELSIFRAMADAIQSSKIRAIYSPDAGKPLRASEALYMGTKAASPLFGKVGSFEKDYAFDCVVIDDSLLTAPKALSVAERVERVIYLDRDIIIRAKFVGGDELFAEPAQNRSAI